MSKFFSKERFRQVVDVIRVRPKEEVSLKEIYTFKKGAKAKAAELISTKPKSPTPSLPSQRPSLKRSIIFALVLFCVFGGVLIFLNLRSFNNRVLNSLEENLNRFSAQSSTLQIFNLNAGRQSLLGSQNFSPVSPFQKFATEIWPLLKSSVGTYQSFNELANQITLLLNNSTSFINNFPDLILSRQGEALISQLEALKKNIDLVIEKSSKLALNAAKIKEFSPTNFDFYLPLQTDLSRYQKFLGSFLNWLKAKVDHHLFVMILNPSEIRPGGGFLGSYADVVVSSGSVKSVNLHDINDLDREFKSKIIPPEPLEVIATRWRAADSNWFFDFPTSAGKLLQMAETSNLYSQEKIVFDGALAVTGQVIQDLLKLTGPLEIPKTKKTITADNFLFEIQKEVQFGQASSASYPKKILQDLTPLLVDKLVSLTPSQKQKLFELVKKWFSGKDIMISFKDAELQNFFGGLNLSGQVYELPRNFAGDYLAVVNANLGGGKTDLFIKQQVSLSSQINADGIVSDHLTISRKHEGDHAKDWWYKVPNQNYLQVFTPLGSSLDNFTGGVQKKIKPSINYKNSGYVADPTVLQIESTFKDFLNYPTLRSFEAFGKNVFATWTKTEPGQKTEIALDYTERLPVPLAENQTYQFVFEKQAGVVSDYHFEIGAPVGFVWQENNLPIFEYQSSDPPGRLILNLTLKKAS
ncbi:MAG: DUF4012 domain-containing protein [Candidatus Liptonbacteria bacterium]|nr:DUF4012 domain-containing protein [Candidatus Liptonbacteria bacterium]